MGYGHTHCNASNASKKNKIMWEPNAGKGGGQVGKKSSKFPGFFLENMSKVYNFGITHKAGVKVVEAAESEEFKW